MHSPLLHVSSRFVQQINRYYSCVLFRKHAVNSACVIRAAIACLNYTGCIKKVYSWKIFPNLTSAQNSLKRSVCMHPLVHLALNLFETLSFLEQEMCC